MEALESYRLLHTQEVTGSSPVAPTSHNPSGQRTVSVVCLLHGTAELLTMDSVTVNQFKRWLKEKGCTFEEGRRHTKVFYAGRFTTLPRHGSRELKTGTAEGIKKRLGLR